MGNARGVNEGELNEVMDAADESGSHPFPLPVFDRTQLARKMLVPSAVEQNGGV